MKRTVIQIDDELCNGCGNCVEGCHEGALQLINGKAVMISDLYCDGLGACIGDCPVGAIELIERNAEPYDEIAVMERISPKGEAVILAHLKHLRDHQQMEWFNQGVEWCIKNSIEIDFSKIGVMQERGVEKRESPRGGGCPGSQQIDFSNIKPQSSGATFTGGASELKQWPVQLHLLNPVASFLQGADLLLASDCSAFTNGSFHSTFLKNRALAIACPKLDSETESYVDKLSAMIDSSKINTLTVLMMEVPCCTGLMHIANRARERAQRSIPLKAIVISLRGEVLSEEWI